MEINCDGMRRKKKQIMSELEQIYNQESKFPDGELLCRKSENRYKWIMKSEDGYSYLRRDKKKLAESLARKKYLLSRKQELESELSACNTYLRRMLPLEGQAEDILRHPEYGRLMGNSFLPKKEELRQWQYSDYEKCTRHEENLLIKGTQGKMLRSKSEAMIDLLLYKNRIPFHYEEKMTLGGMVIYPDFTIRHPETGEYCYWEHFGLMDDEKYRSHACEKFRLYCQNGIMPSVNLIMTFETRENPLSTEKIESIIKEYF
jgi:hypothetical protein